MPRDRNEPDPSRSLRHAPRSGDVVPSRPRRSADDELDEGPQESDILRFSNPTRDCPECKKEVFDDSAVCYHCGHAFERTTAGSTKTPVWIIVTIVLILGAFALLALRGIF